MFDELRYLPAIPKDQDTEVCAICRRCDEGGRDGRFDFRRRCCRKRFLRGLPSDQARQGWIAHWQAVYGRKK